MRKYRLHWSLHPQKDVDWYEAEIKNKMMTEDEVARELDINYSLSVSGKVFAPFREDRHISSNPSWVEALPVYRIWDFGKTNATLFVQKDQHNRVKVLHERVLEDSSTSEQRRVGLSDSFKLFPNAMFLDICDPAGSYTDHREATPDIKLLEGDGQDEKIIPEYYRILELPTRERKNRGRQMIMKDLQETPGGQEAFQIYVAPNNDGGCPVLKRAFQGGYCYKKDNMGNMTDRIQERHPYEDVIDCLVYFYLESNGASYKDRNIEPWINDDYQNPYTGL
jgi:hypothetical protein